MSDQRAYELGSVVQIGSHGCWRVTEVADATSTQVRWYEIEPLDGQKCTRAAMSVRPDGSVVELLRWGVE